MSLGCSSWFLRLRAKAPPGLQLAGNLWPRLTDSHIIASGFPQNWCVGIGVSLARGNSASL